MAEDEIDDGQTKGQEEDQAAGEDQGGRSKAEIYGGEEFGGRQYRPTKPRCNIRIEELARPKKWLMLGTWREFHDVFDPERMQRFKERVQEEFSMTPEETELYFSQLRKHVRKMRSKKALERQLRREKAIAKQEAYTLFKKRLRKALRYAFEHQPPAIVSPVLRDLSDNILEKLAELHHVDVPKRDCTDKNSIFLICIADWAAKLVSNIYYEVDVFEKADTERLQRHASSKVSIGPVTLTDEELDEEEEEEEETLYGPIGEEPTKAKDETGEEGEAKAESEKEEDGKPEDEKEEEERAALQDAEY